jgi:excisionase family DNA binding protein
MSTPNPDKLLTREEAADYLGIAPQTLSVWACTGRYALPFTHVGSRVRYWRSDLDRFVNERRTIKTESSLD